MAAAPARPHFIVLWPACSRTTMPPLPTSGMWLITCVLQSCCTVAVASPIPSLARRITIDVAPRTGEVVPIPTAAGQFPWTGCVGEFRSAASVMLPVVMSSSASASMGDLWPRKRYPGSFALDQGVSDEVVVQDGGADDASVLLGCVGARIAGRSCRASAGWSMGCTPGRVLRVVEAPREAVAGGQLPHPLDPSQGAAVTAMHPWATGGRPGDAGGRTGDV